MKYDMRNIMEYAVRVFGFRIENQTCTLGEEIAYTMMRAATGAPLSDHQKELIERHSRDGKVQP